MCSSKRHSTCTMERRWRIFWPMGASILQTTAHVSPGYVLWLTGYSRLSERLIVTSRVAPNCSICNIPIDLHQFFWSCTSDKIPWVLINIFRNARTFTTFFYCKAIDNIIYSSTWLWFFSMNMLSDPQVSMITLFLCL